MPKKTAKNKFEKMLEELLQEQYKHMLSERTRRGIKQAKQKKSRKRS